MADNLNTQEQLAVGTIVVNIVEPNPARDLVFEIGDSKQLEFYPQFKSLHWSNECNFSVRLQDSDPLGATVHVDVDGKIVWKRAGRTARFYKTASNETYNFEIEVEFAILPTTNILTYTIQTKGLDFFYQPELTQDEITEGSIRPPNIVGSYAVYHSTKAGNFTGGKEYSTGKAFHIYRPKAIDAKGMEVLCDLNINTSVGLLTIIVPQEFLDNATYPVLVDPTFGYTSVPGTANSIGGYARAHGGSGQRHTASSGDTITSFSAYVTDNNGMVGAAYDFSGGVPVNRLAATALFGDPVGSPGWAVTPTVSQALSAGVNYTPAMAVASGVNAYYDTGAAGDSSYDSGSTLDATWAQTGTQDRRYGLYATYTAGGGVVIPVQISIIGV